MLVMMDISLHMVLIQPELPGCSVVKGDRCNPPQHLLRGVEDSVLDVDLSVGE